MYWGSPSSVSGRDDAEARDPKSRLERMENRLELFFAPESAAGGGSAGADAGASAGASGRDSNL